MQCAILTLFVKAIGRVEAIANYSVWWLFLTTLVHVQALGNTLGKGTYTEDLADLLHLFV